MFALKRSVFALPGNGIEGFELASGWHGDMRQCRLLCVKAAAGVGGHHRTGNHQNYAGGRLEVWSRTHTHTHTQLPSKLPFIPFVFPCVLVDACVCYP